MTRVIASAILLAAGLVMTSPGCSDEGVGDPCTPEQEYDPSFTGFKETQVNVESKSFQCRTRVCLVNGFRGRVSCPFGQGINREEPAGAEACTIPGTGEPVTGLKPGASGQNDTDYLDRNQKSFVPAQLIERRADRTVYCSCRCADINGNRPGDQTFCDCPDGFVCSRLVKTIGAGDEGLTGSYCIKRGTEYDPLTATTAGTCTPDDKVCGGGTAAK